MSKFSQADIAAVNRVADALLSDDTLIHDAGLAKLRDVLDLYGAQDLPPKPQPSRPQPTASHAAPPSHHAPPPHAAAPAAEAPAPDPDVWAPESEALAASPTGEDKPDADDAVADIVSQAVELNESGNHAGAAAKITDALMLKPNNCKLWAMRSEYWLRCRRPRNALADGERAVAINPDNARALRARGKAFRHSGKYAEAQQDLGRAQQVDFSDDVETILKNLNDRITATRRAEADARERAAQARAAAPPPPSMDDFSSAFPGGFPSMGGMGGGGGMPAGIPPGMEHLLSDPDVQEAFAKPGVAQKLMGAMSNPAQLMQLMSDPEVGPILMKLQSKFGGGGAGGMRGGPTGGSGPRPASSSSSRPAPAAAPTQPAASTSAKPAAAPKARDDLD